MLLSELNTTPMVGSVLATTLSRDGTLDLPPIHASGYEYVVAANGLFIRAEDSRMEAMVPVLLAGPVLPALPGLIPVQPYARLKLPRVPEYFLGAVLDSALRKLPAEAMYQFTRDGAAWRCRMPIQTGTRASLEFADDPTAVIDLHSHGAMNAFFSATDDADERGLRFYVVVGKISTRPMALARVGVYGSFMTIPLATIFNCAETHAGPFADLDYAARVSNIVTPEDLTDDDIIPSKS